MVLKNGFPILRNVAAFGFRTWVFARLDDWECGHPVSWFLKFPWKLQFQNQMHGKGPMLLQRQTHALFPRNLCKGSGVATKHVSSKWTGHDYTTSPIKWGTPMGVPQWSLGKFYANLTQVKIIIVGLVVTVGGFAILEIPRNPLSSRISVETMSTMQSSSLGGYPNVNDHISLTLLWWDMWSFLGGY